MAKIVDILNTERDRQKAEQFNVVHMYKTGQFYTAYDWSASHATFGQWIYETLTMWKRR